MTRLKTRPRRRRPGPLARYGPALLLGPLCTVGALAALDHRYGAGAEPAFRVTRVAPEETAAVAGALETVPPARVVSVAGMTPGPAVSGPLRRVTPAEPEVMVLTNLPVPETLYRRVTVLDPISFRALEGRRSTIIRLAGLAAPPFEDTCTDAAGTVWPCGARARAELARLIGGRAVGCRFVEPGPAGEPVAACRVGPYDLSTWMVENGWAEPSSDANPDLADRAAAARALGLGRHGAAPDAEIAG